MILKTVSALCTMHTSLSLSIENTSCPCRVRGQVLVAQEHQPLPTEPDLHPFDASGSPRVPPLVFQRGRYAMSDSLRLSYFPRWIFSWHVLQTGICFRLSIRRIRLKPVACRLSDTFRICRTWCISICTLSSVSPQMQHGWAILERDLICISDRMRSISVCFLL